MTTQYFNIQNIEDNCLMVTILTTSMTSDYWDSLEALLREMHAPNKTVYFDFMVRNVDNILKKDFNKPVIAYTMEAFQRHPSIDGIVVVCIDGWHEILKSYARQFNITKLVFDLGITYIPENAFINHECKEIVVPASVTTIESKALYHKVFLQLIKVYH